MTRPTHARDDDEVSSSDSDRGRARDDDRSRTRRDLLRSGTAVALALASAGCLSNPWSPGATRRGPGTTDAEDAPGVATTVDDSGGDGTTAGDGTATSNGDDGTATATEDGVGSTTDDDTGTATATETTAQPTATEVPASEKEPDLVVEVAPDGFMFSPESFEISAGDTVHWQWKDSGHNVRVKSKPDGSDWTGTPGDATDTYGEGYLHAHTFEESGEYEYYCAPHRSLGLRGSFSVR